MCQVRFRWVLPQRCQRALKTSNASLLLLFMFQNITGLALQGSANRFQG